MSLRSTKKTVIFRKPFTLEKSGESFPPGQYVVETVEESLKAVSFIAFRRIQTILNIPSPTSNVALSRSLEVNPDQLDAALKRDAINLASSLPSDFRPTVKC